LGQKSFKELRKSGVGSVEIGSYGTGPIREDSGLGAGVPTTGGNIESREDPGWAGVASKAFLDEKGNIKIREVSVILFIAAVSYVFLQDNGRGDLLSLEKLLFTAIKCIFLALIIVCALALYRVVAQRADSEMTLRRYNVLCFLGWGLIVSLLSTGGFVIGKRIGTSEGARQQAIEEKTQAHQTARQIAISQAIAMYHDEMDTARDRLESKLKAARAMYRDE